MRGRGWGQGPGGCVAVAENIPSASQSLCAATPSWISSQLGAPGFRVGWRESAVDEAFGFVSVDTEGGTVEERSAVQVLEAGSRTQRRATSEKRNFSTGMGRVSMEGRARAVKTGE
jgi:hypothetical protein